MDTDLKFVVFPVWNQFKRKIIGMLQPDRRRIIGRPIVHEILKRHREDFLDLFIEMDIILFNTGDFPDEAMNDCAIIHDIVHLPQNFYVFAL